MIIVTQSYRRAHDAHRQRLAAASFEDILIDAEGRWYAAGDTVRVASVSPTALLRTNALGTVTHVIDGKALVSFDDGYVAVIDEGYEVRLVTGFDDDFGRHTGRWRVWPVRGEDGRIVAWRAGAIRRSGMSDADPDATALLPQAGAVRSPEAQRAQALEYARRQARKNSR